MARQVGMNSIVTGGAGSIGLVTARLLLAEGACVTLVDFDAAALDGAVKALASPLVLPVVADVTSAEDTRRYVAAAAEKGPIDLLFSNAGNDGPILPITDYPDDMFDTIMAVHVRGAFLACKHAIPLMADGGSIVVTSSVVGVMGVPNNCAYVAAKHALVGLVRGVAKEVARRGIRVNAVNPGPVANAFMRAAEAKMTAATGRDAAAMFDAMMPLGRHVEPEEVARAVLFLGGPQSSFTTGTTLMVEGGMSA